MAQRCPALRGGERGAPQAQTLCFDGHAPHTGTQSETRWFGMHRALVLCLLLGDPQPSLPPPLALAHWVCLQGTPLLLTCCRRRASRRARPPGWWQR